VKNPIPAFHFSVVLVDQPFAGTSPGADQGDVNARVPTQIGQPPAPQQNFPQSITMNFSEVSGVASEMEVEQYREGGNNGAPLKFYKWGRFPNLVCKRGVTENTALWDWYQQVLFDSRPPVRRNGFVLAHGTLSATLPNPQAVAAWFMFSAIPERIAGPVLNARTSEIAIEYMELSHQGMLRMPTSSIGGLQAFLGALGT
jgi:phage tail-like protein